MKTKVLIYTLTIAISFIMGDRLPFFLEEERIYTAIELFPLDINQDKTDEILKVDDDNMQLFDQKGKFYWDFYFTPLTPKTVSVVDFNKDGLKEIFFSYAKSSIEFVDCYRPIKAGDLIKRLPTIRGVDKNHDGKWDGLVAAIDGIDANDDGNFDLLLSVGCSFDLQPRGLAVYDLISGKELWHYWIGPAVAKVIIEDLNNDQKPEIIIGTYSVANGCEANNTTDLESYVIVLDRKGKLIWQKNVGDYFTQTLVAVTDIDHDGLSEVIAAQSTGNPETEESDKLVIFEGKTGREKKFINTGENYWGMVCLDINQDGREEIITGNADGKIRVFDNNLEEIMNYPNKTGIEVMGVADLIGDGRKEIIATSEDNQLLIFNHKLNKISQLKLAQSILHQGFGIPYGAVKLVRYQKKKKLLIRQAINEKANFVLCRLSPVPLIKKSNYLISAIAINLIILGFLVFHILYWLLNYSEKIAKKFYSKITEIGYIIIDKKGKVKIANEQAGNLLGLKDLENSNLLARLKQSGLSELYNKIIKFKDFVNFPVTIKNGDAEKNLSVNFFELPRKNTFTIRIEDISKYVQLGKIEQWAPVAQKLAHGMKTPLMNIQLATQQLATTSNMENNLKTKQLLQNLNEEVMRLRKLTDGLLKFIKLSSLSLNLEDINVILKDLANKYLLSLPKKIKINLTLDEKIPKVMLDRAEIEYALSAIIDNALEAMPENGTLTINSVFKQTFENKFTDWVEIIIADTGKGIPVKYLDKIFDPYFSLDKPNGVGLGLTLAKQIVEKHRGNIQIQSKEGLGTSVIINLPINK